MDPRVDRAMNLLRRNSLIYIHSQPRPTNAISEKWAVCGISGHDNSDVDKESMVRPTYAGHTDGATFAGLPPGLDIGSARRDQDSIGARL